MEWPGRSLFTRGWDQMPEAIWTPYEPTCSRHLLGTMPRLSSCGRLSDNVLKLLNLNINFIVSTLADSGLGSLRSALEGANSLIGFDNISFASNLAGGTVSLASALPTITDQVSLNGIISSTGSPQIGIDVCGSPEVTNKVAVHCDTLRVSNQTGQGNWSNWRLPLSQQKW